MKVVVVGSGGRLGAALARTWQARGHEVVGLTRAMLDLGDAHALRATLEPLAFDILVNCAAQTNVDQCEIDPESAMRINADAVRHLGELCAVKKRRCIHFSTDYVFDGARTIPYTEEDEARPISKYGASKRAGEVALLESSDEHLVVRVSWVFGPDRPSFVDQIIQRATAETKVAAVADKVAVPTFTLDVATLLEPFLDRSAVGGILHLCNAGECSWQEYGQHALDCAQSAGLMLKTAQVEPLRMADIAAFVARRPPYTAMSTAKLTALTGERPRTWQSAVEEYVQQSVRALKL